MEIRIEGHDLPGRSCAASPDVPEGYDNVHVAVPRRGKPSELLDLQPGDARLARWSLTATPTVRQGGYDITGPHIQGGPGGRFIYLSWGTVGYDGEFTMFRRAKLLLADVDPGVLATAIESGLLVAHLGLTDGQGHPICARVRPPAVQWSAG